MSDCVLPSTAEGAAKAPAFVIESVCDDAVDIGTLQGTLIGSTPREFLADFDTPSHVRSANTSLTKRPDSVSFDYLTAYAKDSLGVIWRIRYSGGVVLLASANGGNTAWLAETTLFTPDNVPEEIDFCFEDGDSIAVVYNFSNNVFVWKQATGLETFVDFGRTARINTIEVSTPTPSTDPFNDSFTGTEVLNGHVADTGNVWSDPADITSGYLECVSDKLRVNTAATFVAQEPGGVVDLVSGVGVGEEISFVLDMYGHPSIGTGNLSQRRSLYFNGESGFTTDSVNRNSKQHYELLIEDQYDATGGLDTIRRINVFLNKRWTSGVGGSTGLSLGGFTTTLPSYADYKFGVTIHAVDDIEAWVEDSLSVRTSLLRGDISGGQPHLTGSLAGVSIYRLATPFSRSLTSIDNMNIARIIPPPVITLDLVVAFFSSLFLCYKRESESFLTLHTTIETQDNKYLEKLLYNTTPTLLAIISVHNLITGKYSIVAFNLLANTVFVSALAFTPALLPEVEIMEYADGIAGIDNTDNGSWDVQIVKLLTAFVSESISGLSSGGWGFKVACTRDDAFDFILLDFLNPPDPVVPPQVEVSPFIADDTPSSTTALTTEQCCSINP